MAAGDRTFFDTVDDAVDAWGAMPTSDRGHLRAIVQLLVEKVGTVHTIYVGQSDSAIGMSFGPSDRVGLYLHRKRIDVAPETVKAFGGQAALAHAYPGFVSGPGQRSAYARFPLVG